MTAGPAHRPLPFWVLFLYGLPAVALAIPTIPVYVYLPSFYATEIGLSLTAVGAAMLTARLLDVVTDPLIGVLADALPTRFGRRKPWIALGALIGGYAMMQLFVPAPGAGPGDLLLWAALLYLGWSLVAIPYAAWGAELSTDYHERARITSVREGASLLGVLAAGAVLAAGPRLGWTGGESQVAVGMLAIALGAPALAAMLWAVPEMGDMARQGPGQSRSARSLLAGLHRNRAFLRLIAAWFLNGLANGLPAALFPLYLTHGLRVGEELQGALIFGYFVSGVAAIPLWLRLSRRLGKHRAWCVAMLLCCAAFAVVPFIAAGDWPVFLAVCVVTGAALGADLALPPAMQADLVDYDAWKFSRPRPGILFALWSMASKMALAASVGIAFPVLDLLGFDAQAAVNTPQALLGLAVIYALVPVVIKLMGDTRRSGAGWRGGPDRATRAKPGAGRRWRR